MTTNWKIEPVTADDGPAVARNTGGAFWEEPMWKLQWRSDVTQDFLIEQLLKRQASRLLRERAALRHQKAVDPESGRLVGYARWRLPDNRTITPDGTPEWAEAQIPDVGEDRKKELDTIAAEAWWDPRTDVDELDDDNDAVKDRVVAGRSFLELEFLAVHPDNKGKGIGSSLVESGIRQAEKMGLPIIVVCYKAAQGVYRRLGFVEVDRITKDDTAYGGTGKYSWYYMVYDEAKTD
ncbi:hypothetical protein OQA88_9993 [Cercophora sp. LCS_1]